MSDNVEGRNTATTIIAKIIQQGPHNPGVPANEVNEPFDKALDNTPVAPFLPKLLNLAQSEVDEAYELTCAEVDEVTRRWIQQNEAKFKRMIMAPYEKALLGFTSMHIAASAETNALSNMDLPFYFGDLKERLKEGSGRELAETLGNTPEIQAVKKFTPADIERLTTIYDLANKHLMDGVIREQMGVAGALNRIAGSQR